MVPIPPYVAFQTHARRLGRQVWRFSQIESTNTLALALADDPAHAGLALLADEQTSGRGQYGRTWTAPPGSSVLLSLLIFPPPDLRRTALLTAWAAVGVCEAIRKLTGLEPSIKWPNDVLLKDRKICGILIEQRNTGHAEFPLACAVGIGLNVRQSAAFFAQADLPQGGSLASVTGKDLKSQDVAERLLEQLDQDYDRLILGDTHTLEGQWLAWLGLAGQHVVVELAGASRAGRLEDLTWEGIVLENDGELEQIRPELVRHLTSVGRLS